MPVTSNVLLYMIFSIDLPCRQEATYFLMNYHILSFLQSQPKSKFIQFIIMRGHSQNRQSLKHKLHIQTSASITDYQYNHNATQLAVADSDGFVYIYHRSVDNFHKVSQFRGDEAAIWKISWADPLYGEVIAIGSFKRKVAIFQLKNNNWAEIAYHQLHQGSVNHVQWAASGYGLKLYSSGSQGSVAIIQLKKNAWSSSHFHGHECSISGFSLRPFALNEQQQSGNSYPMLATVGKDNIVKIWKHTSQFKQQQLQQSSRIYQQVVNFKPHKDIIRSILWKKRWFEASPIQYELFTCSEDGSVKLSCFESNKLVRTVQVCKFEEAIFRIAQSLTGNMLSVSVANEQQKTYLYSERESADNWALVDQLK